MCNYYRLVHSASYHWFAAWLIVIIRVVEWSKMTRSRRHPHGTALARSLSAGPPSAVQTTSLDYSGSTHLTGDGHSLHTIDRTIPPAVGDDSQSIVLKISKSIRKAGPPRTFPCSECYSVVNTVCIPFLACAAPPPNPPEDKGSVGAGLLEWIRWGRPFALMNNPGWIVTQ